MLVLSRKRNESVVLTSPGGGCLITVTVVEIRGRRIKLGFEAGADVPIHRSEVWEQKHANGRPEAQSIFSSMTTKSKSCEPEINKETDNV